MARRSVLERARRAATAREHVELNAAPARPWPGRMGRPITGEADPRWVLATRTAEQLEGDVLPAEKRASLIRLCRLLGLSLFDANLVIAIVQDQARRGHAGAEIASVAEPQLSMVELPIAARVTGALRRRKPFAVGFALGAMLGLEILAVYWWLVL
jgi:hypothetical protein